MKSNQTRSDDVQKVGIIGGERRSTRRYGMQLQLRWKLVRRRREIDAGTGRTIDMSSGGILFETGCEMAPGLNVELSIAWPVLLHNVAPMQLHVTGRIVRSSSGWAAIRTVTHEFRTAGVSAEHRRMLGGAGRTQGMLIQMQKGGAVVGGIH
jgi:PilZ domain